MNIDLNGVLDAIQKGGVPALALFILYGGFRRYWVFGWQLDRADGETQRERENGAAWREVALAVTDQAAKFTNAVEAEVARRLQDSGTADRAKIRTRDSRPRVERRRPPDKESA